ncbi:MAG: hypothetical protein RXP91_04545 [Nitrososphaeria archaeon]
MRWPPPTPSAALLVLGSLALALASQGGLRPPGAVLAPAAAAATLASYGRLYASASSRSPRPDPPALALALSPYAIALALEGPRLAAWYAPPAAAFAAYLAISLGGRGRSAAGLTAGAVSLASLSAALSGILGSPLPYAAPLCAAWGSLAAFNVLLVEGALPSRGVPRAASLVPLAAGLAASLACLPPLGLAFADPLYLAIRHRGRRVDPRDLRRLGIRLAASSTASLAIMIAVALASRGAPLLRWGCAPPRR